MGLLDSSFGGALVGGLGGFLVGGPVGAGVGAVYGAQQAGSARTARRQAERRAEIAEQQAEAEQARRDMQAARINALFGQPGALEELQAAQQRFEQAQGRIAGVQGGGAERIQQQRARLEQQIAQAEAEGRGYLEGTRPGGRSGAARGFMNNPANRTLDDERERLAALDAELAQLQQAQQAARGAIGTVGEDAARIGQEVGDARMNLERAIVQGADRQAIDMFADEARFNRQQAARGVGTASTGVGDRREALSRLMGNRRKARQAGQQGVFSLNQQLEQQRQRLLDAVRGGQNVRFNSQDILGQQRSAIENSLQTLPNEFIGQAANTGAITISGLTEDANRRNREQAQLFSSLSAADSSSGRIT